MSKKKKLLRSEKEILGSWGGSARDPLVSVLCITYNHVDFIADSIHGFLIQETSFPFEILVHDDASDDGTSEIIRYYQSLYPNIIKAIIQEENQYTKGNMIYDDLKSRAVGKYIAFSEGDDYWTDPNKLQIQFSYLESNPGVSVTGHDSFTALANGDVIVQSRLANKHKRDYQAEDLIMGKAWMLNLSLMYRNVDFGVIPERGKVVNNDKFLISLLGNFGGSHYHPEIKPACHVKHDGGVWSGIDMSERNVTQINSWFWIYRYYRRIGCDRYADAYWEMYLRRVFAHSSRFSLLKEFLIKMFFIREIFTTLKG